MKKSLLIGTGLIMILLLSLLYKNSLNKFDWEGYKNSLWLLNDSSIKLIDTSTSFTYKHKDNALTFLSNQSYNLFIWECRTKSMSLFDISSDSGIILSNIKKNGNVLFAGDNPEIYISDRINFQNSLHLHLDGKSSIQKSVNNPKYKGFIGKVNKLTLSNENADNQIIFDYSKKNKFILCFQLIRGKILYTIVVDSDEQIDQNIFKIFKL